MLKTQAGVMPRSQRSLNLLDYRNYISDGDHGSDDEDCYSGNKGGLSSVTFSESRLTHPGLVSSLCTGFQIERRIGYPGEEVRSSGGSRCCTPFYDDNSLSRVCSPPSASYWTANEVAKAGRVLAKPPMVTSFADEEEMRRVYGLIYDTFRYKHVLQEVLLNVDFYHIHPQLEQDAPRLWLLLFVMILRHFTSYDDEESRRAQYAEAGMSLLDDKLTAIRIRLGAAVARVRIKNNALRLTQLLPAHLAATGGGGGYHGSGGYGAESALTHRQQESQRAPLVSAWTNGFKCNRDVNAALAKLGLTMAQHQELDGDKSELRVGEYRFDRLFPNYVHCRPSLRSVVTCSQLCRGRQLVVQDRAFAFAAVVFARALEERDLFGYVAQTDATSPRATSYLAKCLSFNMNIMGLLVFNAGRKKSRYERIFSQYGPLNIKVFAGSLQEERDCTTSSDEFSVVAALVSPPCSLSGVRDPLDLAVGRGGDVAVLHALTERRQPPPSDQLVARQRRDLATALEGCRYDFVLYATHSVWREENEAVVSAVLNEMNKKSQPSSDQSKHGNSTDANNCSVKSELRAARVAYSVTALPKMFCKEDLVKYGCGITLLQRCSANSPRFQKAI